MLLTTTEADQRQILNSVPPESFDEMTSHGSWVTLNWFGLRAFK